MHNSFFELNTDEAFKLLMTEKYYICGYYMPEYLSSNNNKIVLACKNGEIRYYDHSNDEFNDVVESNNLRKYTFQNSWLVYPLPFLIHEVKFTFDEAFEYLKNGQIIYREKNKNIYLLPDKLLTKSNLKISTEDLFSKDWKVYPTTCFSDVLNGYYLGKSIRRKSWPEYKTIDKFQSSINLSDSDMFGTDWEILETI